MHCSIHVTATATLCWNVHINVIALSLHSHVHINVIALSLYYQCTTTVLHIQCNCSILLFCSLYWHCHCTTFCGPTFTLMQSRGCQKVTLSAQSFRFTTLLISLHSPIKSAILLFSLSNRILATLVPCDTLLSRPCPASSLLTRV